MNPGPILALVLSIGMILLGNYLEGGHISSLMQLTAGMIVVGGTLGATWLGATPQEIKHLFKLMPRAVFPRFPDRKKLLDKMVEIAGVVRRDGLLAVEGILPTIQEDFLGRGLRMLVDGQTIEDVRKLLELEMDVEEHHQTSSAKLLENAGGYAPTVGILGAVLGLIHTMQNLSDPSKLGGGIAVAFVATVYGVGLANLLFLPLGAALKKIVATDIENRAMILTGLEVIASGANPRQLEEALSPYLPHAAKHAKQAA